MTTKTIPLACGRTMILKSISLQRLAATTDIDIPNSARNAISDLCVYGAMITGRGTEKERAEENWALVRSQMQLAKLLCHSPKLWLCTDTGEMPAEGYIPDDDICPADLSAIQDFFYKGGSDGVPAAGDSRDYNGTSTDSQSTPMGETAE